MKKFMVLHYGFSKPSAEDMAAWNKWFESIASVQVERGHFPGGRKITADGTEDLAFGEQSITGFTMIEAEDLDAAEAIAKECPIVLSTRVYEIVNH